MRIKKNKYNLKESIDSARSNGRTYIIYLGEGEPTSGEKTLLKQEKCKLKSIGVNLWKIIL